MQIVDYNPFAQQFVVSRKDMQWPEIEYFFDFLGKNSLFFGQEKVLDVGCGSGRLVNQAEKNGFSF
jgi:2-polyprenyl-3-methyl-5-hydroxy-6-metoxy-1,4-benzoquinol methylase